MKNRITHSTKTPESSQEAMKLLRNKYLQSEEYAPALNMLEVLIAAYPEAQLPTEEDGEPGGTDWQTLAWRLAIDFVPGFQPGGTPGRPEAKKDGLVEAVDNLVASGVASSIAHACRLVTFRELFPGIKDVSKAYYRRKKKLGH